jgi:hypothetical protein
LRGGAKKLRYLSETFDQCGHAAGLQHHVVIQEKNVAAASDANACVHGFREAERRGADENADLGMFARKPLGGAIGRAVIADDDFAGPQLRKQGREEGFEQYLAIAAGDDDADAGRKRRGGHNEFFRAGRRRAAMTP